MIFLIIEGYLCGTEIEEGGKEILCYPPNISPQVRKMLFEYYRPEGFKFYDIEKEMGKRFKEILGEEEIEEREQSLKYNEAGIDRTICSEDELDKSKYFLDPSKNKIYALKR